MKEDVGGLQGEFSEVCFEVDEIHSSVMPEVASWIVTEALDAGDFGIVGLSHEELRCLVDISSGVWTIPAERHQQGGTEHQAVNDENGGDQQGFIESDPHKVEEHPNVQCPLSDLPQGEQRLLLPSRVGVVIVRPIKIHDTVIVIMRFELAVNMGTGELVKFRVLRPTELTVGVVGCYLVQERREDDHSHVVAADTVPVGLEELVCPIVGFTRSFHLLEAYS
mmetsp:Transcript_36948/g.56585  ORF Transcript_36948/g.56585 Transcript_36948/m.56585 type:complete len:222 (+) Transcript_36948:1023-1688(+)